jgi:hypothetical protein
MSKQKGRVGLYLVTSFLSLNEICFDSKKRTVRERERERRNAIAYELDYGRVQIGVNHLLIAVSPRTS